MPRLLLVFLALALGASQCDEPRPPASASTSAPAPLPTAETIARRPPLRAVTLDARRGFDVPALLAGLKAQGVTDVVLIPFAFQGRTDNPALQFKDEPGWYTESVSGMRAIAQAARPLGMGVILKPQIWIGGYDENQWSANVAFETEAEWREWETRYRAFILKRAALAEELNSPLFVIGTELEKAAEARPAFFRERWPRRCVRSTREKLPTPPTGRTI